MVESLVPKIIMVMIFLPKVLLMILMLWLVSVLRDVTHVFICFIDLF